MIDFPDNPSLGQVFYAGLSKWIWDGEYWQKYPLELSDLMGEGGDFNIDGGDSITEFSLSDIVIDGGASV